MSGKPATIEHRLAQLKKLRKIFIEESDAFAEAVYMDLRRKHETTLVIEIGAIIPEIDHIVENLKVIFALFF